jgi:hypothetical protein
MVLLKSHVLGFYDACMFAPEKKSKGRFDVGLASVDFEPELALRTQNPLDTEEKSSFAGLKRSP